MATKKSISPKKRLENAVKEMQFCADVYQDAINQYPEKHLIDEIDTAGEELKEISQSISRTVKQAIRRLEKLNKTRKVVKCYLGI